MNFYKHHIGDYAAATAHLTWDEDMAYTRLMRAYYRDEKPIPISLDVVHRLVKAKNRAQKQAVEAILTEFFSLQEDGWHSKRCDAEILRANAQAVNNKRIAEEREAAKQQRIVHGRPNQNGSAKHNESSTVTLRAREPSQTPDSRLQKPDTRLHPPSAPLQGGQRGVGTFKKVGAETLNLNRHELARIPERRAKTTDELEREEAARAIDGP